ncbi:MAG: amino acid permease [Crocinitomix sp.]|nr:amino acid permease [Crocinitomix sp.]
MSKEDQEAPKLRKRLSLGLLVFYGVGATIGAGIYVLIGAAAGYAGIYAPLAFIIAAIGIIPTAMSYAELSSRYPVSSGEAVYVKAAFRSKFWSLLTGGMVILSGIIASATISIGCAGYLHNFIDINEAILITAIILIMGGIAIKGILESVLVTAVLTVIEAGALIVLIVIGFSSDFIQSSDFGQLFPPMDDFSIWPGIISASAIAVFAFIGFEDMVNVAEETKNPRKVLPRAIFITLLITALLYTLISFVAISVVPSSELMVSDAPLSLVYERLTGGSPLVLNGVAVFATANTILVQIIMVSRVVYGMSAQNNLPKAFGKINKKTKTPLRATLIVTLITLILALSFPLVKLAEVTSFIILGIWILINLSLIKIKLTDKIHPEGVFKTSLWIPIVGAIFGFVLLGLALFFVE